MNSTPAASSTRRIVKSFAVVSEVPWSFASARLIVLTPRDECWANSWALHFNRARADLIWAPVNGLLDILTIWVIFAHGLSAPIWVK